MPGSNAVLHMSLICSSWVRLMWSTAFDPGLDCLSILSCRFFFLFTLRPLLHATRNARWPYHQIPPPCLVYVQHLLRTVQRATTGAKLWLHARGLDSTNKEHSAVDTGGLGESCYSQRCGHTGKIWRKSIREVLYCHLQPKRKAVRSLQRRTSNKGNKAFPTVSKCIKAALFERVLHELAKTMLERAKC